ncbi:MAG: fructose bisphosphate aldolase [Bacillota bacterium]
MNSKQAERMRFGKGFIAALDQSGGSTPKTLAAYGISPESYSSNDEMFDLIHKMRTRIITSPAFTSEHILAAILFEQTMDRKIDGLFTGDYLWEKKGIIPFVKVDKGLSEAIDGVQLMKEIKDLDILLDRAIERKMFGTKMRSVIKQANPKGISEIVDQQFMYAEQISMKGLVPIIEPEVDIYSPDKEESENLLKKEIIKHLDKLPDSRQVMLKLSIPSVDNFYADLIAHPRVMRVVALSGGFSQEEANEKLARNHNLIASFSRALSAGLTAQQTDEEFNETLAKSINDIYNASIS